jgi:hypothetical protein
MTRLANVTNIYMNAQTEHIISFVVATGIASVLLFYGMRIIAKIQLRFGTALWISFIACVLTSLISFGFGFFFADYMGLAVIFSILVGLFVQATLFQVAVRATSQTLSIGKAYILSLLVLLAYNFVASPIVA